MCELPELQLQNNIKVCPSVDEYIILNQNVYAAGRK